MPLDILFDGGHIFNVKEYPEPILLQSLPMRKLMGKNIYPEYALVNVFGARKDLAEHGYGLRVASDRAILEQNGLTNPFHIMNKLNGLVKEYFEEDLTMHDGFKVLSNLISPLLLGSTQGLASEYGDHLFATSVQPEGTYNSYQFTFYSLAKASFCFIVLSLISFEYPDVADWQDGIRYFDMPPPPPKWVKYLAYSIQVFEIWKKNTNVLYNFGSLNSGHWMSSLDGKHQAILSHDGNLTVDMKWQTSSGGKGTPPYTLEMRQDGSFVICDKDRKVIWSSESKPVETSSPPYRLELQDDGDLVVYDKQNSALWAIGV